MFAKNAYYILKYQRTPKIVFKKYPKESSGSHNFQIVNQHLQHLQLYLGLNDFTTLYNSPDTLIHPQDNFLGILDNIQKLH